MLELITKNLKDMVVKASKGAGNDKLSPLTTYLCIDVIDNVLYLRTTDGANFVVTKMNVKSPNFTAVVECTTFTNLIKKITSEHVTLKLDDDVLYVNANGKYKVSCLLDEHGQPFEFPRVETNFNNLDCKETVKVKSRVFKVVSDVNTASVSKVLDTPVLTGFYFGESVMTTDSLKLCSFDVNVFKRPVLLSLDTIKLLTLFNEEDVMVTFVDNDVVFSTDSMTIFSSQMQDIESYPVETLQGLLSTEYPSSCKIKKVVIMSCLDRLAIFVNEYEKNAILLHFTKQGLEISSKKATETIPYDGSENFKDFTCLLDLTQFKEQLTTLQEDIVQLFYGSNDFICIQENKIAHILSTMEEM